MVMKECKLYYLSVEGETEKWYFEHLKYLINASPKSNPKVKWELKVRKSPYKYAKSITALYPTQAFHICDYESNDPVHVEQFKKVLKELKEARRIKKNILYELGYSNYTFELWMILHKIPYLTSVADRTKYLKGINTAYNENFQFLDDYKEERNFKRLLSKIDIEDVIRAITNANAIRFYNEGARPLIENFGFRYYKDNPDLTINKCVEKILRTCGLL